MLAPDAIPGERAPSDVDRRAGLAVPKGRAMMRTLTLSPCRRSLSPSQRPLFLTASRCISNPAASWRYWALPAAAKHAAASAGRAERAGQRRNPLWRQAGRPRRMGIAPEQRDIGMVFQDYALWPHMSVAQNVAFPLRMRGVSRSERERRVSEALARVGLNGFAERKPSGLSGGQQQRVALARAIVAPRVLLFDEPLSNLDSELRESLCGEMSRLLRQLGITALYVTHDRREAELLADQIVYLSAGRVAAVRAVTPTSGEVA